MKNQNRSVLHHEIVNNSMAKTTDARYGHNLIRLLVGGLLILLSKIRPYAFLSQNSFLVAFSISGF